MNNYLKEEKNFLFNFSDILLKIFNIHDLFSENRLISCEIKFVNKIASYSYFCKYM